MTDPTFRPVLEGRKELVFGVQDGAARGLDALLVSTTAIEPRERKQ